MKLRLRKLCSVLLALLVLVGSITAASAVDARASDYFSRTEDWCTALDGCKVLVEFDVTAPHTMTTLGASSIAIWEKQSSGAYKQIKLFTRADGIMHSNTIHVYDSVTYQGKEGTKYYAVVTYYATDANGSEALYSSTNTVTATANP